MRPSHLCACLILFAACATAGNAPKAPEPTVGEVVPGMVSYFTAPRSVRQQDSVPMRLVVRNETDTTTTLIMQDPTLHGVVEFRVEDASGNLVFNSMHGVEPIMLGLGPVHLPPGDSVTFSFTWGLERSSSEMDLPPWGPWKYEGPYVTPGKYRVWPALEFGHDWKYLPKRPLEVLPAR